MSGSAAKIQTSLARARAQSQHYMSKERAKTKVKNEKDARPSKSNLRYLDRSVLGDKDLVVELFCRSSKGGLWSFFKEILINDATSDNIEAFQDATLNGGIQEELGRAKLAEKMSSQCYGLGMGVSPLLPTLLLLNPEFKRLKPHLLQFGYKCLFDEKVTIVRRGRGKHSSPSSPFPLTPLYPLDMSRERKLTYTHKPRLDDMQDVIASLGERFDFLLPLLQRVDEFLVASMQGEGME
ncbi:hypothetical protein EON65_55830, partial [archaeon]